MIDKLHAGIEQVNLAYIEKTWTRADYLIMICVYLVTFLLAELKLKGKIGFYENYQQVGYWGWLTIEDKTLFFAPTKAILLDTANCEETGDGTLSPFGELP